MIRIGFWLAVLRKDNDVRIYGSYYGEKHKVYDYVCGEIDAANPEFLDYKLSLMRCSGKAALMFDLEEVL